MSHNVSLDCSAAAQHCVAIWFKEAQTRQKSILLIAVRYGVYNKDWNTEIRLQFQKSMNAWHCREHNALEVEDGVDIEQINSK